MAPSDLFIVPPLDAKSEERLLHPTESRDSNITKHKQFKFTKEYQNQGELSFQK
jgi:hypothetical protein